MFKKILAVLLFFLVFASLVSPVEAAWSDPKKISTSSNINIMPSITTDATGYLHAVWMELTPGDENFWSGNQNPGIYYSKWNGDIWSTPVKIYNNTGWVGLPSIAADSLNQLHAVWDEATSSDGTGQIMYSMYSGNSWSAPISISTVTNDPGKQNWSARVAVDSSNIVHVIYNTYDPGNSSLGNQYYYTQKSGTWSTPVLISDDCVNCQHASLAVGPGSTVTVALWGGYPAGNGIWIKRNSGSGWGTAPIKISGGNEEAQYPKMIADGTGKLHIIWAQIDNSTPGVQHQWVRYASSTDGITWSAPITLNTNDISWTYWGLPLLGLTKDSKNNIYAGWGEQNAVSGVDIKYRKWNGTSWAGAVFLKNVLEADSPYLFQDKWDNQHFVWSEKNQVSGTWDVWYSILPAYWATIGSGGGSLTVNPNNVTLVTLTIPSGALSTTIAVSAAIGPLPQSANLSYVNVPRSYYFGPSGQTFSKNITTVYTYNTAELGGGDPRNLGVYVWNGQTNSWTYQTGTVNTTTKTLTAKTNHFSLYGMMTPRVKTDFSQPSYTLSDQNPLTLKFTLTYMTDNSEVKPPDTEMVIKNNKEEIVASYLIGKSDDKVLHYNGHGEYSVKIDPKKTSLAAGEYTLIPRIAEVEQGSAELTVR